MKQLGAMNQSGAICAQLKKIGGLLLGCYLVAQPCQAMNLSFLKNSLVNEISKDDMPLLQREVGAALNENKDKQISRWTSASGVLVQILPKLSYNGTACRRTLFKFSQTGKKSEQYRFDICKDASGKWGISQTLAQQITPQDLQILQSTLYDALNDDAVGAPVSWFNSQSKVSGVVVVLPLTQGIPNNCRNVALSVIDDKGTGLDGNYGFCKKGDSWERKPESK